MGVIEKGTQIDHYIVEGTLGEGGMGEVYLAKDINLDRKVAIKTLIPSKSSEKLEKRFENEAKILASLNHGNIVGVYNYGKFNGVHYMVMEFIQGQDLSALIKSRGFGIGECIETFQQMVNGIHEAHSQGVLHRDIKPANIVVDSQGRVKVVDFGISKDFKKEDANLTEMGKVIGTTNYMAPELFVGQRPSAGSDIFSLGIVLFEMLEGYNPFTSETRYQTMENIRKEKVRLSKEVARIVPPVLEKILYKMLEKDPAARYQNLAELKQDFSKIDLSAIPSELMSAKRPEVMILNEHKIRMKLLSQGFATREIGIILSLAAQIQEKSQPLNDQTDVIEEGKNQKIALSQEALDKAINRFKNAQSRLSASRETNFAKDLTSVIQEHAQGWSGRTYSLVGLAIAVILGVSVWLVLSAKKSPILTLEAPAPLVEETVGNEVKVRVRLLDKESGEMLQDNTNQIRYTQEASGERIHEILDIKSQKRLISSESPNVFLPTYKYQTVVGDEGDQIFLGDYNGIFPLELGKTMTYETRGKSLFDGKFQYTKQCTVIGKKDVSIKLGTFPTWVVECVSVDGKTGLVDRNLGVRKSFYSPYFGNLVKSEAEWTSNGRRVIETRELAEVIDYTYPTY